MGFPTQEQPDSPWLKGYRDCASNTGCLCSSWDALFSCPGVWAWSCDFLWQVDICRCDVSRELANAGCLGKHLPSLLLLAPLSPLQKPKLAHWRIQSCQDRLRLPRVSHWRPRCERGQPRQKKHPPALRTVKILLLNHDF